MRIKLVGWIGVLLVTVLWVSSAEAAYVLRKTVIANGAMVYTGNTLGLSKASTINAQGTLGSIGTFISTDTTLLDIVPAQGLAQPSHLVRPTIGPRTLRRRTWSFRRELPYCTPN